MTNSSREWPTPEWFTEQLTKLLAHGALANQLLEDAPDLVDVLVPRESHAMLADLERAAKLEKLIRKTIRESRRLHGPPVDRMLRALLGLVTTLHQASLRGRTEAAARVLGIQARSLHLTPVPNPSMGWVFSF
jgi:hypothetical protein